jgi:hypothetical protein
MGASYTEKLVPHPQERGCQRIVDSERRADQVIHEVDFVARHVRRGRAQDHA